MNGKMYLMLFSMYSSIFLQYYFHFCFYLGGWKRKNVDEGDNSFQYTNQQVQDIVQTVPLREFIHAQYLRYIAHVCRQENSSTTKKLLFAKASKKCFRDPLLKIAGILGVSVEQAKKETQNKHKFAELVQNRTSSPL